jgi:site-specific DNA-methyltransferase (adenine-specific)
LRKASCFRKKSVEDSLPVNVVIHGDCIDVMRTWPDGCVSAVITDPPYGITANSWDKVPDLDAWWKVVWRICTGPVVMTASQPFTSEVVMSQRKWFKWADVWHKSQARGHLNAKVMPLREHEDILVFGKGRVTYNPQFSVKPAENIRPNTPRTKQTGCYGDHGLESERSIDVDVSYPRSVVRFNNDQSGLHPTQKPQKLFEYLVMTYTNEGEVVCDPFGGSGTTAAASQSTGRKYVSIESSQEYCDIQRKRLSKPMLF